MDFVRRNKLSILMLLGAVVFVPVGIYTGDDVTLALWCFNAGFFSCLLFMDEICRQKDETIDRYRTLVILREE